MTDKYMYKVQIPKNKRLAVEEIVNWCNSTFGPENTNWYWSFWHEQIFEVDIYFHFTDSKHSNFFMLKWL